MLLPLNCDNVLLGVGWMCHAVAIRMGTASAVPSLPRDSRGIHPLHAAVVADAIRGVPQVVALVVDAVGCLLVSQVPFHLVLGCSVGPAAQHGSCQWNCWGGMPFLGMLPGSPGGFRSCRMGRGQRVSSCYKVTHVGY